MKLASNLLKITSALAIATSGVASAAGFATNQYIAGTATNSGVTYGNYTFSGNTTFGGLNALNISATITTQQEPVSKSTGTSGNETVTYVSKAVVSKITNSTILELAGITTKGATLGTFTVGTEVTPVAVVKSGSQTILTSLEDFLAFEDGEIQVLSDLNSKSVSKNDSVVSSSNSTTYLTPTGITIGDIDLSGVTNAKITTSFIGNKTNVKLTATTTFSGFVEGEYSAPVVSEYNGPTLDGGENVNGDGTAFILNIGRSFSITPLLEVASVGQGLTTWKATGLPSGLTINSFTGVISGKLNTGVLNTVYAVDITATNAYGSTTIDDLTITISSVLPSAN